MSSGDSSYEEKILSKNLIRQMEKPTTDTEIIALTQGIV